jgi:hypothetical protein
MSKRLAGKETYNYYGLHKIYRIFKFIRGEGGSGKNVEKSTLDLVNTEPKTIGIGNL